jgi:predicted nucleic acid-binding protein
MSSVSLFELEVGVVGRQGEAFARQRLTAILSGPIQVEPFDNRGAITGAQIAAKARFEGKQLSSVDAMIAGHAAVLNAKLVTDDAKLAAALSGVDVIGWG